MLNLNQSPQDDAEPKGIIGLFEELPKVSIATVGSIGNFAIATVFEGVRGANRSVRSFGTKAIVALEIVVEGIVRADHPELYPDDDSDDSR
jgi:hypothetical protein